MANREYLSAGLSEMDAGKGSLEELDECNVVDDRYQSWSKELVERI